MPNTKTTPGQLLHNQIGRLINGTKATREEVLEILVTMLSVQIAEYEPLVREEVMNECLDTVEQMALTMGEQFDAKFIKN